MVDSEYIKEMNDIFDLEFSMERYAWLYDVHKLAIKKGFIK